MAWVVTATQLTIPRMTRVPRVLPVLRVNNTLSLPLILREIDTSPAGTLVPLPQIENEFNEDVMGPI